MAFPKKTFFITGTDTDVGKTFISCALLTKANQQQRVTGAIKPVAAGCDWVDGELKNSDALLLQSYASLDLPYQSVNPITLEEPIAPHIAAQRVSKTIQASRLEGYIKGSMMTPADVWLVEGAGGWLVPLNHKETLADLAVLLSMPVILVVAIRLGCINHALLTASAIRQSGLPLAGWVANCMAENSPALTENIDTLVTLLDAPCLGKVPRCVSPEQAAEYLDWHSLLDHKYG